MNTPNNLNDMLLHTYFVELALPLHLSNHTKQKKTILKNVKLTQHYNKVALKKKPTKIFLLIYYIIQKFSNTECYI